jgi:Ser-tRNA(Ala) deacylase AlaX
VTDLAYLDTMEAAYERSFQARVVSLPPGAVVLDRTLFYPTGGGQPHDEGTLRGSDGWAYRVVDVTKSGTSVLHRLDRNSNRAPLGLRVGDDVLGEIDWDRRHRFMRMHSAQHLVSALAFHRVGLRTHRAELHEEAATVDLERPWPPSEPWDQFAAVVSEEVAAGRAVRVRLIPRAEWNRAPTGRSALVPLPPSVDPVRVIEIQGIDDCPCGGTHVRSTQEVGGVLFDGVPRPHGTGCRIKFTLGASAPTTPLG